MHKTAIDTQRFLILEEKVEKIYEVILRLEGQSTIYDDEPLIDNYKLSQILHVSTKTLYRLRKKNLIPYTMCGDKPRYSPSQIYRAMRKKICKCDPKYINDLYKNSLLSH